MKRTSTFLVGTVLFLGLTLSLACATMPAPPAREELAVDPAKSVVRWVGRNLAGRHEGAIAIGGGEIALENGRLTGGRVVLDMTAMTCGDIDDSKMNRILIAHLQSDDFFDTDRFPTSILAGAVHA